MFGGNPWFGGIGGLPGIDPWGGPSPWKTETKKSSLINVKHQLQQFTIWIWRWLRENRSGVWWWWPICSREWRLLRGNKKIGCKKNWFFCVFVIVRLSYQNLLLQLLNDALLVLHILWVLLAQLAVLLCLLIGNQLNLVIEASIERGLQWKW